jgi:hypothetical protein
MPQGVVHSIEELLRRRHYGADAISGVSFQVLCAIRESLTLFRSDPSAEVRLEGLEDADLRSTFTSGQLLLQMKHSVNPWQPSGLRRAVESFLEALRLNRDLHFALLLGGPASAPVARALSRAAGEPRSDAIDDLILRALQLKNHTDDTAQLASVLQVVSVDKDAWGLEIVRHLADLFDFGTGSAAVFARVLAAEYLEWSSKRLSITLADIFRVHQQFREEIATEQNYQAIGRGLISRIDWTLDASVNDFVEGKRTRAGHVAASLDIPRPTWVDRIRKAQDSVPVCVIRASSGQGKSTLLFRYAFEYGQEQDTYMVRSLQTTEELSAVREFLRFRGRFQGSILLLIDNADWRTRLWCSLAADCAAMPLRIVVSTRIEDWTRYADTTGFGYEVVEPTLDTHEAASIFGFLSCHGRVHASVPSREYAWEKLGEPRLLMEYVYLVSHGTMLRERLADQVATINRQHEDPAKLDALRIVALSSLCGCEVPLRALVDGLTWRDDPSFALGALTGEYIAITATDAEGLHVVRSGHLTSILHDGVHPLDQTAIKCLQILNRDRHRSFLSAIFSVDGLDVESFWIKLLKVAHAQDPAVLLDWLDGLFFAGEWACATSFSEQFAESINSYGRAAVSILVLDMVPFHGTDLCAKMQSIVPDQQDMWRTLAQHVSAAKSHVRGIDFVRRLLLSAIGAIRFFQFHQPYSDVNRLLGWCVLANVPWPGWSEAKEFFMSDPHWSDQVPDSLAPLVQNMYRYDQATFESWWMLRRDAVLAYFRLHTLSVDAKEQSGTLSVAFIPDDGGDNVNDQATTRLRTARQLIPCALTYESRAIWFLPGIGTPTYDDSRKHFDASAQPWPTDVCKNQMWLDAAESRYRSDSYYLFFRRWHRYRLTSLTFAEELVKVLDKRFARKQCDTGRLQTAIDEWLDANRDLDTKPPKQAAADVGRDFEKAASAWAASFRNFGTQIVPAIVQAADSTIRLACHNFRESQVQLGSMHKAFAAFHASTPDYFDSERLATSEARTYDSLSWRLIVLENSDPGEMVPDPERYGRRWAAQQERRRNEALGETLRRDASIAPRFKVFRQGILWYAAVECAAANCKHWHEAMTRTAALLNDVRWIADVFLLIPRIEGTIRAGAVQLSGESVQVLAERRSAPPELLAPSSLEPQVLSEIPFALKGPPPEPTILERILALPSYLLYCRDLHEQTSMLTQSPYEFDHKLLTHYQARIERLLSDFSTEATALMKEVESRNCRRLVGLLSKLAHGRYGDVELGDLLDASNEELLN